MATENVEIDEAALNDRLEKLRRLKELRDSRAPDYSGKVEHPAVSMAKDTARSMGKGALDMLAGIGTLFEARIDKRGMRGFTEKDLQEEENRPRYAPKIAAAAAKIGPDTENMTEPQKLWGKVSEGAGAAAAMPVGGLKGVPINLTSGAMGGLGGELGDRAGKATNIPYMDKILQFIGTLTGGVVPGLAFGGARPGIKAVRDAVKDTPPAAWDDAAETARLFNSAGARTATMAETLPGNTRALALAEKARSGPGGEKLAERIAGRENDLQGLGTTFLNRITPNEVSGNLVANQVSGSAEKILQNLAAQKNSLMSDLLRQAPSIRPDRVAEFEKALLDAAKVTPSAAEAQAYREIAKSLRHQATGEVLTSPQDLSIALYRFQPTEQNIARMNAGGGNISAQDLKRPLADAKSGLAELSPQWDAARSQVQQFNQNVRAPVQNSPIGALADRTPSAEFPTPVSRLNKITSGTTPDEAGNVLGALFRGPREAEPANVIRAMMQEKLAQGSANPGQTVRGAEGSLRDRQLAAMLAQAERDPGQVMEPLRAADRLQGMRAPQMAHGIEEPPLSAAPIAPSWWMRTKAKMSAEHQKNATIAEMLGGPPTLENLARLRKLAENDPSIRAYLVANGVLSPTAAQVEGR